MLDRQHSTRTVLQFLTNKGTDETLDTDKPL
jgi:hypothetical protein